MQYGLLLAALLFFQTLSAQDKNYTEWYLQRDEVDIFVKELGTGKDTVIVLHGGFGANHDYMEDAIRGLEKDFHFILYDQRGSLLSPAKKENLTFQKNVDDLHVLITALKLKRVNLFCHSMGTLVGMELVNQYPNLVNRLVLAGSVPLQSDSLNSVFGTERYKQQIAFLENRPEVQQLILPFKQRGIDSLKAFADIERFAFTHRELTEYWRIQFASVNIFDMRKHQLMKGGRAYYKGAASVMVETVDWKYDYREKLNTHTRTTIINGDHDFFDFRGELFTEQLKEYRNISLRIIPRAGHNSWIDQSELFRKLLKSALQK